MDAISILKFFDKLGKITLITPIVDNIPSLDEINPLKAYIGFEIDFCSDCDKSEIEDIFEFVIDDIELSIYKTNTAICQELQTKGEAPNFIVDEKRPIQNQHNEDGLKEKKSFSLRIDSSKIDTLINKISEMVVKNAQIAEYALLAENEELEEIATELGVLLEEARESVFGVRMAQVGDSFSKYRRVVNDIALKLGKEIEFVIEGEDTELDKSIIEKLSDPLTHMIRNSVDHGIETPIERLKNDKPAKGRVVLRAYPDSGSIVIELEDDGRGVDKDAVLQKAITSGIVDARQNLSDKEIYRLIFAAGLSTATQVSDLSGRGVGMDVVKRNIEELRGSIDIDSKPKKGSKITVRLPLTLAIIDGFLIQAGCGKYIIPLDMVVECIEYNDDICAGANNSTVSIRGNILPLLHLRIFFGDKITKEERNHKTIERENIVVVRYGNSNIGIRVDELCGEQQVVIKSLGAIFDKTPGISGGTTLGNGDVALILDIPRLIEYKIQQGAN